MSSSLSTSGSLPERADVVVLGAGSDAMAAAWQCALKGLSVVVLRCAADPNPNQKHQHNSSSQSVEHVNGVRIDVGSHRLHPATPRRIIADLEQLLGSDLQRNARHGRIRIAGRWVRYPAHPGELLKALPPQLLVKATQQSITSVVRRRLSHPDTYAGVIQAGLGPALYEQIYAPLAVKLWGLHGDQISSQQAHYRVSANGPIKLFSHLMRAAAHEQDTARSFYYPRQGFGQITDAYTHAALQAGVVVVSGHSVERIRVHTAGAWVKTAQGGQLSAGRVFSTLPLPSMVRLVSPGAPAAVVEAASRLRFRGMIFAYLGHQGGRWSSFDAHHIPDVSTRITRISEPANYRINPQDPSDRSVICVEIPASVSGPVWQLRDEQIVTAVIRRLGRIDLPSLRLGQWAVVRHPCYYPVFSVGYEPHLAVLENWVAQLPYLTSFGRLGLFAHEATHHGLIEAYAAADAFVNGQWDEASWLQARGSFADHVIED